MMMTDSLNRFAEIRGAAYERYLLDLMKRYAAEEDRTDPAPTHRVLNVELAGDGYPHRGFVIETLHLKSGKTRAREYALYGNPGFYDKSGDRIVETDVIVGDTLMIARGG